MTSLLYSDKPSSPLIQIKQLGVQYTTLDHQSIQAIDGIEIALTEGEFCVIVGPSGCGKSTLLKVLAGLVPATQGSVSLNGQIVDSTRNDIGFVFQNATLLPWLSILVPLRIQQRPDRGTWVARAHQLLEMVGLSDFASRYPSELSGGMQQRVGMARALIHDPSLLLMDEPFGALDALTRETMNSQLQSLWMKRPKTVLFVTHSISEAVFLADRILVMSPRPGKIEEIIPIDLPRPRSFQTIDSVQFTEYAKRVRGCLHSKEIL